MLGVCVCCCTRCSSGSCATCRDYNSVHRYNDTVADTSNDKRASENVGYSYGDVTSSSGSNAGNDSSGVGVLIVGWS